MENEKKRTRIPFITGITVTAVFTCVLIYAACTYFYAGYGHATKPLDRSLKLEICPSDRSILARSKRAEPTLIKRVARPLSPAPPMFALVNGSYDPPLYHDQGAKCAWGHLTGKRVPKIEDVGVAYDSQQLGARICDDPETCKSLCLRMHKADDPYLCNYFTWNREKKVALFYFLEPTIKWNLTLDERVETYFWQCKETPCTWYWRPHRIALPMSGLTATQLRSAKGLISVTQCTDFATCQFACETRPSYKELQEEGQEIPIGANPDDPVCDYVVMPSTDTRSSFSFLFSMHQSMLKNVSFAQSTTYDSFELVCKPAPAPASSNSNLVVHAPPGQPPRPPHNRKIRSLDNNQHQDMRIQKCRYADQEIDCSKFRPKLNSASECVQLIIDYPSDRLSISVETTKSITLAIDQPQHRGENIDLSPGRKYVMDMRNQVQPNRPDKCDQKNSMDRRCAAICNDRMAVDTCGCSINNDPQIGYTGSDISVPFCDDNQMKSCVVDQLRSENFFQCMDECKMECSTWNSMIMESTKSDANLVDLEIYLMKSADIETQPIVLEKDIEHFLKIWAPVAIIALLILVLSIALIMKCC